MLLQWSFYMLLVSMSECMMLPGHEDTALESCQNDIPAAMRRHCLDTDLKIAVAKANSLKCKTQDQHTCLPEVCQKVLNDRCGDHVTNIFCIAAG